MINCVSIICRNCSHLLSASYDCEHLLVKGFKDDGSDCKVYYHVASCRYAAYHIALYTTVILMYTTLVHLAYYLYFVQSIAYCYHSYICVAYLVSTYVLLVCGIHTTGVLI